jgi:two-component system, chemotaxis family, sensor kinase CheA
LSDTDDRIIEEFLADSHEGLDRLDRDLIELEKDPHSQRILADAFRTLHTIKGTCSFLGYTRLEHVAHAGENLMSRLRSGQQVADRDTISALLGIVDAVRAILASIEDTREEGAGDDSAVVARAEAVLARGGQRPPAGAAPEAGREPAGAAAEPGRSAIEAGQLRVDVGLLDRLMNMVGELVLARNQMVQLVAQESWSLLPEAAQRLNVVTSRLQEEVMRTRMQPVGSLLSRLPRLVRDVAQECGKRVVLETEGAATELDKTLIDAIKDPLLHLVRNAIDHGLEKPEVREARGKAAAGRLRIVAFHEGGQVHLEVADDGDGIAVDRVRQVAIERRLVPGEDVDRLTDREWLRYIFVPGFSTAARVTSISGRGVGMDVVRSSIEGIGGTIDVDSRKGQGTTFRLRIPLTLAIIPALMVEQHGERYALPQVNLLELVHLRGADLKRIEMAHEAPVLRLRGRLLPLLFLGEQLGLQAKGGVRGDDAQLAVVHASGQRFGIVVDQVHDTEEIVVKPLHRMLRPTGIYAGATILGDGRVALILDVPGLGRRAGIAVHAEDAEAPPAVAPGVEELLLVRVAENRWAAVQASRVSRIEVFEGRAIESAEDQPAVQWRGRVLPIVPLAGVLGRPPARFEATRHYHVLVHTRGRRPLGFLVDEVEDIVRAIPDLTPADAHGPVRGRAILRDRVTDLLELDAIAAGVGGRNPGAEAA